MQGYLTKYAYLYTGSYKTMVSIIKEDIKNGEVKYFHRLTDSVLLRCQFFPN